MRPVAVAIMAKAPRAGEVKTRLCPPLTHAAAAALYRCFLLDKIAQVGALAGTAPVLAFTPAAARPDFEALAPGFRLLAQRGVDLGARLHNVLGDLLADGHAAAVAVDSDTPTLPGGRLQAAVDQLSQPGPDLVLGPTEDGGYYLIGLRAARPALFEGMPWSTPAVLGETLRRAEQAGISTACLAPWADVDTAEDLARLRLELTEAGRDAPAHTAGFFATSSLPPGAGVIHHGR